jgi:hypothetical protein
MKKLFWVFVVVIAIGFSISLKPAKAALLTFELGQGLISATFDDSFGNENTVQLTMTADNLVNDEFIDDWYFNFDPVLDPTKLTFTEPFNNPAGIKYIKTGNDAFKADSYGWYDIKFDFPPPTKGNADLKFTAGESVIYDITYKDSITVSSFNSESSIVDGGFSSAAHYQGGGGGFVSVPDASIMLLLGPSLICLFGLGRKKSKV